ncbi:MAG: hypothetical protein JWP89_6108 [Schlesneria sp.]|nr:hypothetical protein [Schlesneria sp.]
MGQRFQPAQFLEAGIRDQSATEVEFREVFEIAEFLQPVVRNVGPIKFESLQLLEFTDFPQTNVRHLGTREFKPFQVLEFADPGDADVGESVAFVTKLLQFPLSQHEWCPSISDICPFENDLCEIRESVQLFQAIVRDRIIAEMQ